MEYIRSDRVGKGCINKQASTSSIARTGSSMASLISNDPLITMMNMCPVLSTPVDWKETHQAHVFIVDLPGLGKEDVKVEVDDKRVLQISGKSKAEKEERADKKKREKWHRVERARGEFCRRFRLPENVKVDQIQASMENGVLTVTVPKQEINKPVSRVIEIQHK